MPIALTLTQGVIAEEKHPTAVAKITESFLKHHGLAGNKVMTPNVTTHLSILPKEGTYSGGQLVEGAWIETKTPSFALANYEVQSAFFGEATKILFELSEGRLSYDRIWANGVHTVDGTWNLDGQAKTNQQIGEALSAG